MSLLVNSCIGQTFEILSSPAGLSFSVVAWRSSKTANPASNPSQDTKYIPFLGILSTMMHVIMIYS